MTDEKKNKSQKPQPQKKASGEGENQFQWKQAGKTSLVWVVILVSAIFLSNLFTAGSRNEVQIQFFEIFSVLRFISRIIF